MLRRWTRHRVQPPRRPRWPVCSGRADPHHCSSVRAAAGSGRFGSPWHTSAMARAWRAGASPVLSDLLDLYLSSSAAVRARLGAGAGGAGAVASSEARACSVCSARVSSSRCLRRLHQVGGDIGVVARPSPPRRCRAVQRRFARCTSAGVGSASAPASAPKSGGHRVEQRAGGPRARSPRPRRQRTGGGPLHELQAVRSLSLRALVQPGREVAGTEAQRGVGEVPSSSGLPGRPAPLRQPSHRARTPGGDSRARHRRHLAMLRRSTGTGPSRSRPAAPPGGPRRRVAVLARSRALVSRILSSLAYTPSRSPKSFSSFAAVFVPHPWHRAAMLSLWSPRRPPAR